MLGCVLHYQINTISVNMCSLEHCITRVYLVDFTAKNISFQTYLDVVQFKFAVRINIYLPFCRYLIKELRYRTVSYKLYFQSSSFIMTLTENPTLVDLFRYRSNDLQTVAISLQISSSFNKVIKRVTRYSRTYVHIMRTK